MKGNIDLFINNLNDLGRSWATYGLTVGKAALETSASTLKNTADFLGEVTTKINVKPEETTTEETITPQQ